MQKPTQRKRLASKKRREYSNYSESKKERLKSQYRERYKNMSPEKKQHLLERVAMNRKKKKESMTETEPIQRKEDVTQKKRAKQEEPMSGAPNDGFQTRIRKHER